MYVGLYSEKIIRKINVLLYLTKMKLTLIENLEIPHPV